MSFFSKGFFDRPGPAVLLALVSFLVREIFLSKFPETLPVFQRLSADDFPSLPCPPSVQCSNFGDD